MKAFEQRLYPSFSTQGALEVCICFQSAQQVLHHGSCSLRLLRIQSRRHQLTFAPLSDYAHELALRLWLLVSKAVPVECHQASRQEWLRQSVGAKSGSSVFSLPPSKLQDMLCELEL